MQWPGFKCLRLAQTDFDKALCNDLNKLDQYVTETATRVARMTTTEPISHVTTSAVHTATSVIAGPGLLGGGPLTSDVTLRLDPTLIVMGTGIQTFLPRWSDVAGTTLGNSLISDDGVATITLHGTPLPDGAVSIGVSGAPFTTLYVGEIHSGESGSSFYLTTQDASTSVLVDRIELETDVDDAALRTLRTNISLGLLTAGGASELQFVAPSSSARYTSFKAQAQGATITYTLPSAVAGANGSLLSSTTAGVLSWATWASLVDVSITPTWTGIHTFSVQDVHNAGVSLGSSGSLTRASQAAGGGVALTFTSAHAATNNSADIAYLFQPTNTMGANSSIFKIRNSAAADLLDIRRLGPTGASNSRMRFGFDSSNYYETAVTSNGNVSITTAGTTGNLNVIAIGTTSFVSTGITQFTGAGVTFATATSGQAFTFQLGLSIVMADGMVISNVANTTGLKIGAAGDKLGAYSVAPVIQPVGALQAAITNSTGGSQDGTLVDVTTAALADPAKINDNFTDVYALLNAMRTALVATGWMKGAA